MRKTLCRDENTMKICEIWSRRYRLKQSKQKDSK
nr:MAG TPA: hypothetical protein [Caudoviricetes sp.]